MTQRKTARATERPTRREKSAGRRALAAANCKAGLARQHSPSCVTRPGQSPPRQPRTAPPRPAHRPPRPQLRWRNWEQSSLQADQLDQRLHWASPAAGHYCRPRTAVRHTSAGITAGSGLGRLPRAGSTPCHAPRHAPALPQSPLLARSTVSRALPPLPPARPAGPGHGEPGRGGDPSVGAVLRHAAAPQY